MNDYAKDTRALIAALEAYRDKYGFSFDASQPAKVLIQELKAAMEGQG